MPSKRMQTHRRLRVCQHQQLRDTVLLRRARSPVNPLLHRPDVRAPSLCRIRARALANGTREALHSHRGLEETMQHHVEQRSNCQ